MDAPGEIVLRNREQLAAGAVITVLNPADTGLAAALKAAGLPVSASTTRFGVSQRLAAQSVNTRFEAVPTIDPSCTFVIVTLPKEKDLLRMQLHRCADAMPEGCNLWLAGEIRSGIKSAARHLRDFFQSVSKLDNARHCVLFSANGTDPKTPFRLEDYRQAWHGSFADQETAFITLPGVFAHGRLDRGTRLLLDVLETVRPDGRVLDFACGSGVIGLSLLAANRSLDVTLLDDSALALESARRSLQQQELDAKLLPSDGLSAMTGTFDWIVSNPPFHSGVKNDLDIAARFFRDAGTFLTEKGRILVVFNQHLPYSGWLRESFKHVELLAQRDGFNVVQASRPL